MQTYHVHMGQAVVIPNLKQNWVSTGSPPNSNFLQSCSAVILVHGVSGTGGLYHYPASPFKGNTKALEIIEGMRQMVNPTHAAVVRGGTATALAACLPTAQDPRANNGDQEIFDYLEKALGRGKVDYSETGTGFVAAQVAGGKLTLQYFSDGLPARMELRMESAGNQPYGTVFGTTKDLARLVY